MANKPTQPTGPHQADANREDTSYSMYVTGEVVSLQDQADNGGWAVQNMPVGGDAPGLATRMGTRGSFKAALDYTSAPTTLDPEEV